MRHCWKDNTTFSIDNGATKLRVQDVYRFCDNNRKWEVFEQLWNDASSTGKDCFCMNFSSGYKPSWFFGFPRIPAVSRIINPRLAALLGQCRDHHKCGIIIMDFADERMCSRITDTNL